MSSPPDAELSFSALWAELAPIGRHATTGGYRRYALSPEDHQLRDWFAGRCAGLGLELTEDRMGNQWAWWGRPDDRPGQGVVTGSHLDSVPDGGAFDGPLGVVSALIAVDRLKRQGFRPSRPIAVVNFVDEEGARFGVACAGSRVITGAMTADRALGLTDEDGLTMAAALRTAGRDPETLGRDEETLRRIGSFVELHVEQGRALAVPEPDRQGDDPAADRAVAIGTDVWPHGRWRVDFPGRANHAGTTRLADRRDAMLGLATMVLVARQAAERHGCVATVGKVRVQPGGVNAIPSAATAWLDARGADAEAVRRLVSDVEAQSEPFGGVLAEESWTPTTAFTPGLITRLRTTLPDSPLLGTGAGHDAGILAAAGVPSAMLFVRNPTGVSHAPDEWAEEGDCLAGIDALTAVLADLAGSPPVTP